MFDAFIEQFYDLAINTYHVSPVIFIVIYVLSIPFFYVSLFFVLKETALIKKERGKITPKHFVYEKRLSFWSVILLAVFLSPYLYIAFFGENLPLWVWFALVLVVIISLWGVFKRILSHSDKEPGKLIWKVYSYSYDGLLGLKPYRKLIKEMIDAAGICENDLVVDLGVGTGNFEKNNRVATVDFRCFDFSDAMISRAQKKNPGLKCTLYDVNEYRIPMEDNSTDRVVSSNVVYNVKNLVPFFNDVKRVLKPGGRFVFTTSTKEGLMPILEEHFRESGVWDNLKLLLNFPRFIPILFINLIIDNSKNYFFYPEDEIIVALKDAGFSLIRKKQTYGGLNTLIIVEKPKDSRI